MNNEKDLEQKALENAEKLYNNLYEQVTANGLKFEPWSKVPKYEKITLAALIGKIKTNENITLEELHNFFLKNQMQRGFKYGKKRNGFDFTNPKMVHFLSLSKEDTDFYSNLIIVCSETLFNEEEE